ncbi:nuclear transport factor 2 family protein [Chondrinema litorale]|uniref:nuclear transport factor 2 family protein n=1 Tax=Chondrinema litorale TaxID=2994555 RepID=UPI0025426F5D|nr:nuclear transport factor 2 family protein [Chondrinema litorale]UZR97564.1 nuclear transport factor 2 family protein [Chondrinema litorale]
MKTVSITLLLFVLLSFQKFPRYSPRDLQADKQTIAFLDNFRSVYIKSMLENTPELLSSYYDEDVRLMPEFQKTIFSGEDAQAYFNAFAERFELEEYNREKIEILDLGKRVVELGNFTMKLKLKSNRKTYDLVGKYEQFWSKADGGKLSLITEAWNYNHAIEISEQLKFNEVPSTNVALQAHVTINDPISFELAALNKLMEEAIIKHDSKLWAQFYSDEGMFIYSFNPIYKGRKALDDFLEKHTAEMPIFEKLDIRNDQIDDLGEFVIEYASHTAIVKSGDYSGINTGKDLRIWRREGNGHLKIFRAMAMYD